MDEINVDTNQIFPTRFNKVPRGPELRATCCSTTGASMRMAPRSSDFILNREPIAGARIIVAERNFGCGSSRESAV